MKLENWFRFKVEKTNVASLAVRVFGIDFAFILSLTFEDCSLLSIIWEPTETCFFTQFLCFSLFLGRDNDIYD